MKRFFDSITSIDHFTHNLNFHKNALTCAGCAQSDRVVSHGFVVIFRHNAQPDKVGKRIFCSCRYQHTGCGRTFQLYIASETLSFRHNAVRLFVFVCVCFCPDRQLFGCLGLSKAHWCLRRGSSCLALAESTHAPAHGVSRMFPDENRIEVYLLKNTITKTETVITHTKVGLC